MSSYAQVAAVYVFAAGGVATDDGVTAAAAARSTTPGSSLTQSILKWRLEDVYNEGLYKKQLGPIRDTFSSASDWAVTFLPYIAEETRAGLCQGLDRLAACNWLPLDGPPRLERDDDRKEIEETTDYQIADDLTAGGQTTNDKTTNDSSSTPSLFPTIICDLPIGRERSAWQLSGADSGGKAWSTAEVNNAGAKQHSPLKPTDLVLLTNSRERDVQGLTAPGTVYTLGLVRKVRRDEDNQGDDRGNSVQVIVFAPEDGELDAVLSYEPGGCSRAVGALDQWHLVLVGNVATATRADNALRDLNVMSDTVSPLVQLMLCDRSSMSPYSDQMRAQGLQPLTSEVMPSPPTANPAPAAEAVLQAVECYCRDIRRLNDSQQQVVVRVARPHVDVPVHLETQQDAVFVDSSGSDEEEAGDVDSGLLRPEILLVQGPPGTGKTSTIAGMLSVLSGLSQPGHALLVCAPTNAAVAASATRFMSLLAAPEPQQFAALPLADGLRQQYGWPLQAPLLAGDCVLLGSENRMDMSLGGPLQSIFVRARANRLLKTFIGQESWRFLTRDLRRLLSTTRGVHSEVLAAAAEHAAATPTAAADGTSMGQLRITHNPPPATPGGFLKQQLPILLKTLRQTVSTMLEDLPSAVWDVAANDDDAESGASSVGCVSDGAVDDGSPLPQQQQRQNPIRTAQRVLRGRGKLTRLVEVCGELEAIVREMTASEVTAELDSMQLVPISPIGLQQVGLDDVNIAAANDFKSGRGGSSGAGGTSGWLASALGDALAAIHRANKAMDLREIESCWDLKTHNVISFCVRNARLIFSTVSAVGSSFMDSCYEMCVSTCVVDEAAQLPEAELGIVLARFTSTLRQLVLVGDPKQLPATVLSVTAAARGYGRSAFERLQLNGWQTAVLNIQYRMHPAISTWPRNKFYFGQVLDGPNVTAPPYDGIAQLLGLPWGPYMIVDVSDGREEHEMYDEGYDEMLGGVAGGAYDNGTEGGSSTRMGGGVGNRSSGRNLDGGDGGRAVYRGSRTSPRNMHEAAVAVHLTKCVVGAWRRARQLSGEGGDVSKITAENTTVNSDARIAASSTVRTIRCVRKAKSAAELELLKADRRLEIGIISPYRAQVNTICPWVGPLADPAAGIHVAVRSVDGFQGQEQDVIVLSLVRANDAGAVGFTADPRRLNVAATRARHALVVLLHAATLRANPLWNDFLNDAENRGLLHRAGSLPLLAPALKSVRQTLWRQKVIRNGSVDLFRDKPWQVVLREEMQASALKLPENQRVRVLDQLLSLASGQIPARILPFNAVRPAYADILHVHFLEGRRLALIWSVRLWESQKGGWCQALQVWNVLPVQCDDTDLRSTIRRAEAEYDTYTDEHLDALRRLSPADSNGIVVPKYWHGDLPFQRTRPSGQTRAPATTSAKASSARRPAGVAGTTSTTTKVNVQQVSDKRKCTDNTESRGNVDQEGDADGGDAGSRLTSHYMHAKHFLLTATHARQLCLAPEGSIVERMYELTPEQKAVVGDTSSLILIGRSGTGKTSVIIARVLQYEEASATYEGVSLASAANDPVRQLAGSTALPSATAGVDEGALTAASSSSTAVTASSSTKKLRQLIVTLSPILAANTAKYLRRYLANINRTAVQSTTVDASNGPNSHDNENADTTTGSPDGVVCDKGSSAFGGLVDEEDVPHLNGSLPKRLADVPDTSCPLVLDLRRCLEMLDASLEQPFMVEQQKRAEAAAALRTSSRGRTAAPGRRSARMVLGPSRNNNSNSNNAAKMAGLGAAAAEDMGDGEGDVAWGPLVDTEEDGDVLALRGERGASAGADGEAAGNGAAVVEVDYDRFADSYWGHFSAELRKQAGCPALVWREVQSDIKGSLASLSCPGGRLTREKYLALAESRAGTELSRQQRKSVYELFRRYEQEKDRRGEYDIGDLTAHLHGYLAARGYPGPPFRFVYVDEVQDLTPAQVALFKYLCPYPEDGLVLAGDTAQTIAKGVNFRFEALKDLLYGFFLRGVRGAQVPKVTPLLENFRTHAAISRLAHYGVLEPLLHFFPHSLDKLAPESSNLEGPRPLLLLPSCGDIRNMLLLDTSSTTSCTSADVTVATTTTAAGDVGSLDDSAHPNNKVGDSHDYPCNPSSSNTNDGSPLRGDGAAESTRVGGDHEIVVLVPNSDLKQQLKQHLPPSVTVLTALESKGLEYKVVLLYNFFSASRFKPDKWRLLYHVLVAQELEPADVTAPGGRFACPRFDPQAHSLMAPELKALYVAVTRGREDVVVVESNGAAVGPVKELWGRMGLVDVRERLDGGVLCRLQRQLSKEELRQRAQDLYSAGLYGDAAIVFDRLGDEISRVCCEAQLAKVAAKKAFDMGKLEESRKHYGRAAECFVRGGKHPQAARCFERAGRWGEAGDEYHRHCGNGAKAAECYEKAKRWRDAADRLAEIRPLSLRLLDHLYGACCKGAEFRFGVDTLLDWERELTARTKCGGGITGGEGGEAAVLARTVRRLRARLTSLGAVHWKDQPGGREEMMGFVTLMPGEDEQRRWLNRYHLYDLVLQLDIEAGRFLLAAVTCERKGDLEQAVQLYSKGGRVDLAVELLLRRARAAVLWSGSGGGAKVSYDWPPQQPGCSGSRYLKQVNELLMTAPVDGSATAPSGEVSGMQLITSALRGCRLEADLLSYLSSSSAKGSVCKASSSRSGSSGASDGGLQGPMQAEWAEWRTRLDAPGLGVTQGSRVALARLCLLRLLSGNALAQVDSLVRQPTQATQRRPMLQSGAHATTARTATAVLPEYLSTITAATLELLRLWSAYRRFLADVLRVLSRQQVAAASDRDAAVLAAVQSYHVVISPVTAATDAGDANAAGGGGLESTSFISGSNGSPAVLQLGCQPTAAWVVQARERIGLTLSSTDAFGSAAKSAVQLSATDFATAASLYWRTELKDRCKRTLECLLALAAVLVPDYEAFKEIGGGKGLEIGGRRSRYGGGDGQAANLVLDITQLRAQVLVAAVQEAAQLVKLTEASHGAGASQPLSKSEIALAEFAAKSLTTSLELVYGATACFELPAMEQMGSIPAARQAAVEVLELYAREILKAAAARPSRVVRMLSDSKRGLRWERPGHTKLTFEEIARVAILQPLLPERWMLRVEQEGYVDWETRWGSRPEQLSAWQLLLESARVADWMRELVPICGEPAGGHVVIALARFGSRALLDYYHGVSVTACRRQWSPWASMRPLTFLALLERYTLLALGVISRGADNMAVPTSLILDHFTQPGVTELLSYCVRHVSRVTPKSYTEVYDTLCRTCELLSDLCCRPECVCPVNQPQGAVQPLGAPPPTATRPGGSAATGAAAAAIPQEHHRLLSMFLRRALVLLFTVAVNVRRAPAAPPSLSPAQSCLRVVEASGWTAQQATKRPDPGMSHASPQSSSYGLANAMSLLPCTLRLLLDTLRWNWSRNRGNMEQFKPNVLGPEFGKIMARGKDRLLRLYHRSATRVDGMGWANMNRSYNVEEWREVVVAAANGQRTRQRAVFFQLPDVLLNTAAEDISGGDLDDDDKQQPPSSSAGPQQQQQEEEDDDNTPTDTINLMGTGGTLDGSSSDGVGTAAAQQPDAGELALATANRLGRTFFCMTRLWLCRARQQLLLPRLSPLQRLRRAATVAFHGLLASRSGAEQRPVTKAYVARYLEVVCPLQIEMQHLAGQLEHAVRELQQKGPQQPQDEIATAQVLDTALEYVDELAASCSLFDIKRHEAHRAFDSDRLSAAVAAVRQLLDSVRQELGPHLGK